MSSLRFSAIAVAAVLVATYAAADGSGSGSVTGSPPGDVVSSPTPSVAGTNAQPEAESSKAAVNGLKAMSIACTLLLSLFLNRMVVKLPFLNDPRFKDRIRVANAFSAGIFLVLSLGHLLPESVDVILHASDEKTFLVFRQPYIVCVAGYLFMIMIQRGLFAFDESLLISAAKEASDEEKDANGSPKSDDDLQSTHEEDDNNTDDEDQTEMKASAATPSEPIAEEPATTKTEANAAFEASSATPKCEEAGEEDETTVVVATATPASEEEEQEEQKGRTVGKPGKEHFPLIVLLGVFMIHSITEGMVLGLQRDKDDVLLVFLAIFLHQWAEDITFSMRTGRNAGLSQTWRIILTSLEAASAPFGMALGWMLETVLDDVAVAYITTFSAGTFIMIAATEVTPEALPSGQRNAPQFVGLVCGATLLYGVMAILEAFLAAPA